MAAQVVAVMAVMVVAVVAAEFRQEVRRWLADQVAEWLEHLAEAIARETAEPDP